MKRLLLTAPLLFALAAPAAHGATLLRLDGIGPLKLGMSRTSALATNWLSNRHTGCKLGGKPYPIDYDVAGSAAESGIDGSAEFVGGKLSSFSFIKGVRTATGVVPGKTTVAGMVKRYRDAGFKVSARYDETFAGTFVTVKRQGGKQVLGGFADEKVVGILGLPYVPLCE
ncbi:MAG: hypothetical protein JWM73_829 [Solirubrobacterales bacterium]|nr:hypothetical protein [Solirubrobacterales bacterium]